MTNIKDDPDLVYDDDFLESVENLKAHFDTLSSAEQEEKSTFDSSMLNCEISFEEVANAIDSSKLGKAFLFVPNEALKNESASA